MNKPDEIIESVEKALDSTIQMHLAFCYIISQTAMVMAIIKRGRERN